MARTRPSTCPSSSASYSTLLTPPFLTHRLRSRCCRGGVGWCLEGYSAGFPQCTRSGSRHFSTAQTVESLSREGREGEPAVIQNQPRTGEVFSHCLESAVVVQTVIIVRASCMTCLIFLFRGKSQPSSYTGTTSTQPYFCTRDLIGGSLCAAHVLCRRAGAWESLARTRAE